MPKLSLLALLFSAFATQADLLTALQAYEKQHYSKAKQEFAELLPRFGIMLFFIGLHLRPKPTC